MKTDTTSKEVHTQWIRGANYGGTCTISCGQHIIAANVDSDEADLICKAVNERQRLIDSNRELLELLNEAQEYLYLMGENESNCDLMKKINNAKNLLP
jgi:hypothetical protein